MNIPERHAIYYLEILGELNTQYLHGGDQIGIALDALDRELHQILPAQAWSAVNASADETAAHLCARYSDVGGNVLPLRLTIEQLQEWAAAGFAAAERLGLHALMSSNLGNLGTIYLNTGQFLKAKLCFGQALIIANDLKHGHLQGIWTGYMGRIALQEKRTEEAIGLFEQAYTFAEQVGDLRNMATWLNSLGEAHVRIQRRDVAMDYFNQALAVHRELQDLRAEGQTLGNIANLYADAKGYNEAIRLYQAALAITDSLNDVRIRGKWLGNIALVREELGDLHAAADDHFAALQSHREAHDLSAQAHELERLGFVLRIVGDYARAESALVELLEIAELLNDEHVKMIALEGLGRIARVRGEREDAYNAFQLALNIATMLELKREQGTLLGEIGTIHYDDRRFRMAADHHQRALKMAQDDGNQTAEAMHLGNLANAFIMLDEFDDAIFCANRALKLHIAFNNIRMVGTIHGILGNSAFMQQKWNEAVIHYEEALQIAKAARDVYNEANWSENLGNALKQLQDVERARELLLRAYTLFEKLGLSEPGLRVQKALGRIERAADSDKADP